MSIFGTIGKTLLGAAPYIAAPFTGGASLLAAPATNAALSKWNQHDANQRAQQGLGPSTYDRILGAGSNIGSGIVSGVNAIKNIGDINGTFGSGRTPPFAGTPGIVSTQPQGLGWGGLAEKIAGVIGNRGTAEPTYSGRYTPYSIPSYGGGIGPRAIPDMRTPNLQAAIQQGRDEAIMNQPWRSAGFPRPSGPIDINPTMPQRIIRRPWAEQESA